MSNDKCPTCGGPCERSGKPGPYINTDPCVYRSTATERIEALERELDGWKKSKHRLRDMAKRKFREYEARIEALEREQDQPDRRNVNMNEAISFTRKVSEQIAEMVDGARDNAYADVDPVIEAALPFLDWWEQSTEAIQPESDADDEFLDALDDRRDMIIARVCEALDACQRAGELKERGEE